MSFAATVADKSSAAHAAVGGVPLDRRTEAQVVRHLIEQSKKSEGGWVLPVNVDVCRQLRVDASARTAIEPATLIVPDGMPLVWASRLLGQPVPERVAGSALIFSLSQAAAAAGRSIYLLGGAPGVADAAAERLSQQFTGLKIVGTDCPPFGFERSATEVEAIRDRLLQASPDVVYVGLGFPKQERLIASLIPVLPTAWFISCGAAIGFAAGAQSRAPEWMRRSGLEWMHRLASEPRRLAKRYLVHDLPFAVRLLTGACMTRVARAMKSRANSRRNEG